MEIARFRARLARHKRVALDTCIFIYQWENNPRYWRLTDSIFSSVEDSDFKAVTSNITMTELLVHPYREHDVTRVNELVALLASYPNLEWIAADLDVAASAAEIRAEYKLQTPDALQAATALHANATALLSNDPIFKRIRNLDVVVLDDYA